MTISMCMIVKNEESRLEKCLQSYAPLMDEIIIVDTGSTDNTKEIAAGYTNLIYDFTWTGDFSDARNYAASKATCDYIFSADADETLDEENRQAFAILKEALIPEVEIVQMRYGNQLEHGSIYNFDCELRPKLFKRLRTFTWIEPIHETIRTLPVVFDSDIIITHSPSENHAARDLAAFRKMIEEGTPLSDRLHGIYAKELYVSGADSDFLLAQPFFTDSFYREGSSQDRRQEALCIMVRAARIQNKLSENLEKWKNDIDVLKCSELCFELGMYYMEQKTAQQSMEQAVCYFTAAAEETYPVLNIHYGQDYPKQKLKECY